MEVNITTMNHNGEGVGKINNKIIFIPKTITEDTITVKNIHNYKNYSKGELSKIITPSPKRIPPPCKYYNKCGGCQIMNLDYNNQLKYKQETVKNIFKKYLKITINPEIEKSINYNYRNKVTFHIKNNKIGFYEEGTNKFIEINKCLNINTIMNKTLKYIKQTLPLNNINKIVLRTDNNTNIMIILYGNITKEEIKCLEKISNHIYINDTLIIGNDNFTITLGNYKFHTSPTSFFQINNYIALKLYNYIKENIKKNTNLLDLYCGTGSIGIFLSDKCNKVWGVEINKSSIKDANKNKILNNINNINFTCLNTNKIKYNNYPADTIIIDPPRGGLDKKTIQIITKISPEKIIYTSCNPLTLARDIKLLEPNYKFINIKLFDMFPNTYHIECVCILNKKS